MTHKAVHARRSHREGADVRVTIPHSSWSRVTPPRNGSVVIAPDDFWARLGI